MYWINLILLSFFVTIAGCNSVKEKSIDQNPGGLTPQQVRTTIKNNSTKMLGCYQDSLIRNPNLEGRIKINFIVSESGAVKFAKLEKTSISDQKMLECILAIAKSIQFPKPVGGSEVSIRFPFEFNKNKTFSPTHSSEFFKKEFKNRDGCFLMTNVKTGKVLEEFNAKRCKQQFAPMSTFKIPLVLMAFDSKYFKNIDQKIPWDGKIRSRKAVNQDQTPKTFIDYSVIWISKLIVSFLKPKRIQNYVNDFNYGNKKVSSDSDSFWLTDGSIKISANEQIQFLSRFWQEEISIDKNAIKFAKEALFDRKIGKTNFYGKTGTGCIDPWCEDRPGRQLGWYVGIAEKNNEVYAFALNFSDLKATSGYGGLKAREIVHRYFIRQL